MAESAAEELAIRGLKDPVFFAHYFKAESFPGRMPWVHRGLFSILTHQVDFLWQYGEVHKIMREFVEFNEEGKEIIRRIFHVVDSLGREYTWKDVKDFEQSNHGGNGSAATELPTPTVPFEFVLELGLEIQLDLGKYTEILMPRGFSKTTIAGQTVPLYKLLYRTIQFMAYVSESGTHAEMQANNVRGDLRGSTRIKSVFGDLCPARSSDAKWSERFFETTSGFALAARGRGAQIRGLLHGAQRPQEEIWDDLEDLESVETEAQRKKTRRWAYGDAMPALPELDPNATITAIGTLLAADCLLMTLKRDPQWTTVMFGVQDSEGEYLWPEMWDAGKDKAKQESYELAGELATYYLEYRSSIYDKRVQVFLRELFIYQQIKPEDILATAIYCDPAIGEKETADRAVIQVVSISTSGGFYLRDEWSERGKPDMTNLIVAAYFKLSMTYKPDIHGFESVAFQKALGSVFRYEMFRKHYYFEAIPVTVSTNKNKRIKSIVGVRHRAGVLYFCKKFTETEAEMANWKADKKEQPDDGPDCLAGGIELLEDFYGSAATAEEEDYDIAEQNIPDLNEELGLRVGEDWRTH